MSATQLYVGDLPDKTDEEFLRSFFAEAGNITSIVIKKHKTLPKSTAFITFDTHEAAERALNENNYTKLNSIPIRISWSDPETKRIQQSKKGNLVIKGLDQSIEVSQLHEAFSNFGDIISCYIPLDKDEKTGEVKSRGYGYIQFRNEADAERAMNDLADASINGKKIEISKYEQRPKLNPEETFTNIYIKVLPTDQFKSDEDVKDLFSEFGEVLSAKLMMKKESSDSAEFGFCNMRRHEDAVRAVQELCQRQNSRNENYIACRQMTKKERQIFLKKQSDEYRKLKARETQGRNLFVKKFGEEVTDEEFYNYFAQWGEIESAKVMRDAPEPHQSKGFGFVLYKNKEDADKAMAGAMFEKINGKYTPFVTFFKIREERNREKAKLMREKQAPQMAIPQMSLGGSPMAMPIQVPLSPKDRLKQELMDRGISGQQLKNAITSISDTQAAIICESNEKLEKFISTQCPSDK